MERDGARSEDPHRLGIAQEPAREIDVVDGAVEEDAPARWREAHEETGRIIEIEVLRAHQERLPDEPGLDLVVGVAVAWVEAAPIADHHVERGVLLRFRLDVMAV